MTDDQGKVWVSGDCWCTLKTHHDPKVKHVRGPCVERFSMPGWYDHKDEDV